MRQKKCLLINRILLVLYCSDRLFGHASQPKKPLNFLQISFEFFFDQKFPNLRTVVGIPVHSPLRNLKDREFSLSVRIVIQRHCLLLIISVTLAVVPYDALLSTTLDQQPTRSPTVLVSSSRR